MTRLEALTRMHGGPPDVDAVAESFRTDAEARRATVESIAQRVGRYFRVEARRLQGATARARPCLPRQVGMYLARRLTDLSLQQIGAYFGGRDHSTVLHACRKVEQALADDLALSGAVRQLQADWMKRMVENLSPLRCASVAGRRADPARQGGWPTSNGMRDRGDKARPRRNTDFHNGASRHMLVADREKREAAAER